jgi:hypothetical protein
MGIVGIGETLTEANPWNQREPSPAPSGDDPGKADGVGSD